MHESIWLSKCEQTYVSERELQVIAKEWAKGMTEP